MKRLVARNSELETQGTAGQGVPSSGGIFLEPEVTGTPDLGFTGCPFVPFQYRTRGLLPATTQRPWQNAMGWRLNSTNVFLRVLEAASTNELRAPAWLGSGEALALAAPHHCPHGAPPRAVHRETESSVATSSFFFLFFLGLHLRYLEVPRLGVESELQLPVYTTAPADPQPTDGGQGSNPHPRGHYVRFLTC